MRVLLTDILFPSKYAKWRLVEIESFIKKYECDILILNKIQTSQGLDFNFDFDLLKESHRLYDYDILIFNSKFNYINKYNDPDFDGTIFNERFPVDYLLRLKKYRTLSIDLNYDLYYHIFIGCYLHFNRTFGIPPNKQVIHLYSGGGLSCKNDVLSIDKQTKVISSQNFITNYLLENNHQNYIDVYGGPLFLKDAQIKNKNFTQNRLNVCFTSMGCNFAKGAYHYINISNNYKNKYPENNINFYSVGICLPSSNIIHVDAMSQVELDNFYYNNIDIIFSLETGVQLNGFPLGVEAASQGCILFTTDFHDSNTKNGFNIDDFFIIHSFDIDKIIEKINLLYDDINLLYEKSSYIQNKMFELFNYQSTMEKTFEFIESENSI